MDWLDCAENILFVNDYSENIIDFLINKEIISDNNETEKWKMLFVKLNNWKKHYLITSEVISLYGVDGWNMSFLFGEYACLGKDKSNMKEYLIMIREAL